MPPGTNLIANNLPGLVLLILIVAVPLAFLASVGVLSLYRRAVLRAMRTRINPGMSASASSDSSAPSGPPTQTPLNIMVLDSASIMVQKPPKERLYAELLRRPWHAAKIYTIAGLCYALVTTIIFVTATKSGFHLLGFLIIFWYYAWPVVVTICLVATASSRARLMVFAVYFLTIILLGAIAWIGNSLSTWMQMILLWFLTNLPAALLLLAFLNRRIQAVGPLALTFMIFAVTGAVLLPPIVWANPGLLRLVVDMGVALGLGGFGIFIGLILIGFIGLGGIGWLVLQGIGRRYQQKKISVQSITLDAIWLLFGIFQSIGLIFEGTRWFLISLLAFLVYKLVSRIGFSWYRDEGSAREQNPTLLLLRVFSLGKRSERLFDVLAMYWRYVGHIRLIAGPDLATATMEPHEFLDFLSGKLARRFIDNAQTLDRQIAEMDLAPDHDGQFRVNDFFCYDDTWRQALSRLVGSSDIVLMDLRGFSSQNAGIIFEISELINTVPLEQVLFIVDQTTEESFLRETFQKSWEHRKAMSPNRSPKSGRLQLLRFDGSGDKEVQVLLHVLSRAADAIPA